MANNVERGWDGFAEESRRTQDVLLALTNWIQHVFARKPQSELALLSVAIGFSAAGAYQRGMPPKEFLRMVRKKFRQ